MPQNNKRKKRNKRPYAQTLVQLSTAFLTLTKSLYAAATTTCPVEPYSFYALSFGPESMPLCAFPDKRFYDSLTFALTLKSSQYGPANDWLLALKQDRPLPISSITNIAEKHLVSLALNSDLDVLSELEKRGITPTGITLINLLTQWQIALKNNLMKYGMVQQFKIAYQYLVQRVQPEEVTENVELMTLAISTPVPYVVNDLLDQGFDYDLPMIDVNKTTAWLAFTSLKFPIFEMFLKHGFNALTINNPPQLYIDAIAVQLSRIIYKSNYDFLLQLAHSNSSQPFLKTLTAHNDNKDVLEDFYSIVDLKKSVLINFFIETGRLLQDNPVLLLLITCLICMYMIETEYNAYGKILAILNREIFYKKTQPAPLKKSKPKPEKILDAEEQVIRDKINFALLQKKSFWYKTKKFYSNAKNLFSPATKFIPAPPESEFEIFIPKATKIKKKKTESKIQLLEKTIKPSKITMNTGPKIIYTEETQRLREATERVPSHTYAAYGYTPPEKEKSEEAPSVSEIEVHIQKPEKKTYAYYLLDMHPNFPQSREIINVFEAFKRHKTPVFLVGGAIRDALTKLFRPEARMPTKSSDLDFRLKQSDIHTVKNIYAHARPTFGNRLFKTIIINQDVDFFGSEKFDKHENIFDGLLEDSETIPFSIEMVYAEYKNGMLRILDPSGHALKDIEAGVIRTVRDADEVIASNSYYILRAIYYSIEKDFIIAPDLLAAIERHKETIIDINHIQLRAFINKLSTATYAAQIWYELEQKGVARYITNLVRNCSDLADLNAVITPLIESVTQTIVTQQQLVSELQEAYPTLRVVNAIGR